MTWAFLRTNLLGPIIIFRFFGKHCWIYIREHLVSTSKKRKFLRTNLLVPFLNFDFFEEFEEISLFSWKSYVSRCKNCICSILFGQNCMNWILRIISASNASLCLQKAKLSHIWELMTRHFDGHRFRFTFWSTFLEKSFQLY